MRLGGKVSDVGGRNPENEVNVWGQTESKDKLCERRVPVGPRRKRKLLQGEKTIGAIAVPIREIGTKRSRRILNVVVKGGEKGENDRNKNKYRVGGQDLQKVTKRRSRKSTGVAWLKAPFWGADLAEELRNGRNLENTGGRS